MIDFTSPTWKAVEEWANARLASHRAKLEAPQTDDRTSQAIRGALIDLKALLALAKPRDPAELPADQPPAGY